MTPWITTGRGVGLGLILGMMGWLVFLRENSVINTRRGGQCSNESQC